MRPSQLARALAAAVALGVCIGGPTAAHAGAEPDRPGSILIFPKVVNADGRDTTIRIANTGNSTLEMRCYYLTGSNCSSTDFDIVLTKQQPTQWTVSQGRYVNIFDTFGSSGAGFDPGLIPPVPSGFEGALICVETVEDVPVPQNKAKGEAILHDASGSSSTSTYNAIAVTSGNGANNADNFLALNGSEYSQCGTTHRIDFIPEGMEDPVFGTGSDVVTNVTVLPCDLDLSRRAPTGVVLNALFWNELETMTSGGRSFSCWDSFSIDPAPLAPATTFATVQYSSSRPVVMVVESFHSDASTGTVSSAARNVHRTGAGANATIRLATTP